MTCANSAELCPICGEANQCHLSGAGKISASKEADLIGNCWCSAMKGKLDRSLFPDSLNVSLASCICQKCWEKYQEK